MFCVDRAGSTRADTTWPHRRCAGTLSLAGVPFQTRVRACLVFCRTPAVQLPHRTRVRLWEVLVSTILVDRRTAALLGELVVQPVGVRPVPKPTARPRQDAGGRTRPGSSTAPEFSRRRAEVTVRRATSGGGRLRRRLRCEPAPAAQVATGPARQPGMRTRSVPAPRPALHLTRRGRVVGLLLLLAVLTVAFSVGRVTATALSSARAGGAEVVVERGDTLWSIAERIDPDADPRSVSADLMSVNGLVTPSLEVGQHLRLP
jgi:nucleoid-associated protein YgaU